MMMMMMMMMAVLKYGMKGTYIKQYLSDFMLLTQKYSIHKA
jgi:hypothetical protein